MLQGHLLNVLLVIHWAKPYLFGVQIKVLDIYNSKQINKINIMLNIQSIEEFLEMTNRARSKIYF